MATEIMEKPVENGSAVEEKPEKTNGKVEEDEKPAEKTETNGDKKKDGEENGDGGESSEEELGSLEKPVEILTRKRERKSTEFFVDMKERIVIPDEAKHDYAQGKGTPLGDIPYVAWEINNADSEDLVVLHKLMYGPRSNPKNNMIKKNVRAFRGFPFDKEDKLYKSILNLSWRLILPGLRYLTEILGLTPSQDKDKMRDDLLEFLMEPKDTGKEIPAPKKKPEKKKKKTPSKSKPKKKKEDKKENGSDEVSEASDDSGSEDEEEGEKKTKKADKKKEKKKTTPKKKTTKATPVKIAVPMKKKSATKKRKSEAKDEADSGDDEPLVKKKKSPPSDSELKKVVGEILKDADLEQVTMKNVVKQVYDKYSSFDLTSRKDYIKTCVKELIS